jgi:hypothetical protein
MDNRDIVPYAPVPLLECGCHVNSELVNSVKACKYMYKYCYKGYDCANVEMQLNKENVPQTQLNKTQIQINTMKLSNT